MSPCIGLKDCGIARRCILFLGTEFERGSMVLGDPFVWPPLKRSRGRLIISILRSAESTTIWLGAFRSVSKSRIARSLRDATALASSR